MTFKEWLEEHNVFFIDEKCKWLYKSSAPLDDREYVRKCFEYERFENVVFDRSIGLDWVSFYKCVFVNCSFECTRITSALKFNACEFHNTSMHNLEVCDGGYTEFSSCKNTDELYYVMTCPETGSFTAYKKVLVKGPAADLVNDRNAFAILTLEIPDDAKRSSAPGSKKCRASKVKVIDADIYTTVVYYEYTEDRPCLKELQHCRKLKPDETLYSIYDNNFTYTVGQTYEVTLFWKDKLRECAPGIHFFMTFKDAFNY